MQIKLSDHTVVPILLYGSEIWGYENTDCIEQFHNAFLRKITNLRKSTPLYILHAELGRHSLKINIKNADDLLLDILSKPKEQWIVEYYL